MLLNSKFFGNPQGAKSKPQQSTLAFSPAQLSKAETPQGSKSKSTNGSAKENRTGVAKKQEDDENIEMRDKPGRLQIAPKEPALKIEKSKNSRDKTIDPIESMTADEDMKDVDGM